MAGVGKIVTELCRARFVPRRRSHSVATASGMAEQGPELADGTPVTATVGNGGLTPSDPGAVEEWLAFMPPYGGRGSGRAICPSCRGVASSEAETRGAVEGFAEGKV